MLENKKTKTKEEKEKGNPGIFGPKGIPFSLDECSIPYDLCLKF
jgi:hypothetical protein